MNWQSIDPLTLPSVTIRRRSALPGSGAVYFLIEGKSEIVYIGQAANLRSRWAAHERAKACKRSARIAWIEMEDRSIRRLAESSLIARFQPRLNHNHKPGPSYDPPRQISKSELAEWRRARHLTQLKLADYLKVNLNTVSRWEVGTRRIPPYLILALNTVALELDE